MASGGFRCEFCKTPFASKQSLQRHLDLGRRRCLQRRASRSATALSRGGVSASGDVRRAAHRHCGTLVRHLKNNILRQRADARGRQHVLLVDYSPVNVFLSVEAADTYGMAAGLARLARSVPAASRKERLVAVAACAAFVWTSTCVALLPGMPLVPIPLDIVIVFGARSSAVVGARSRPPIRSSRPRLKGACSGRLPRQT